MNAIWSLGQAMFTKVILVVDHDVDVHNYSEVVWKALCAIDPERDVQFNLGPADTLDHASRIQDFGSKMGIDATRKWASEGFARPWPDEILMDARTKARIDSFLKNFGFKTAALIENRLIYKSRRFSVIKRAKSSKPSAVEAFARLDSESYNLKFRQCAICALYMFPLGLRTI
jgi:hypothetical protein